MKFVKKIYMEIKISFKKLYLICDIYICMGLKGLWGRGVKYVLDLCICL